MQENQVLASLISQLRLLVIIKDTLPMTIAIDMILPTKLAIFLTKTFPLDSTSLLISANVFSVFLILF